MKPREMIVISGKAVSLKRSAFDVLLVTDALVVLLDRREGGSVTNDAENVIAWLNRSVDGGLQRRRVFYRDSSQVRFAEVLTQDGVYAGFEACTDLQQAWLTDLVESLQNIRLQIPD